MNMINDNEIERERVVAEICKFLGLERPKMYSHTVIDAVKELCVARLCKSIGITGTYNYKSDFFNFFSSIMGEAVCEKLNLKIHVASDALRLVKYEHINLVEEAKAYLNNETIEEAVIDTFNLADRFKYLIK